jgi:hypothetical protein
VNERPRAPGAEYSIDVFGALDANGVFLVPSQNNTIRIGSQVPEVVVFLDRPLLTPVAISANNEDNLVTDTANQASMQSTKKITTTSWFDFEVGLTQGAALGLAVMF